jgi:hypothetical protein
MKMALIKTNLQTKLSSSNQQQPTLRRGQRNRNRNKKNIFKKTSPHTNWSLHNSPPRKIRNIIPEPPTQDVPALPQSKNPLVRQHRSHRCNKKTQSQMQTKHQIENKYASSK